MGGLVLLTGFVLLGLPLLAARFVSRRLAPPPGNPRGAEPPGGWVCARCAARAVRRLARDGISPHPGYECKACGARMRPRGSGAIYGIVLLLSLGVLAWLTAAHWWEFGIAHLPVYENVLALGVAIYCLRQLARPVVRRPPVDGGE